MYHTVKWAWNQIFWGWPWELLFFGHRLENWWGCSYGTHDTYDIPSIFGVHSCISQTIDPNYPNLVHTIIFLMRFWKITKFWKREWRHDATHPLNHPVRLLVTWEVLKYLVPLSTLIEIYKKRLPHGEVRGAVNIYGKKLGMEFHGLQHRK